MVGRSVYRADRVRRDLLVIDELAADRTEPPPDTRSDPAER